MRAESHRRLGEYLIENYMPRLPKLYTGAFLLGCIQPDKNPLTYLKGSLRCQWLRGHNYRNARRFMRILSFRLDRKKRWGMFDYYALGKLIHYTADAYTYPHNDHFTQSLDCHRRYEALLQEHFLRYLGRNPVINSQAAPSAQAVISVYHRIYRSQPPCIATDAVFTLSACCCMLCALLSGRIT